MLMRIVFFTFFFVFSYNSWAQNTVELEVEQFSDQKVADATLDTALFNVWHKRVMQTCENYLRLERTNNEAIILVTFPKGKPAEIKVSSRPEINEYKIKGLQNRIAALSRPPRSRLTDYAYVIRAKINKGCQNPQLKFLPQVLLPDEKVQVEYEAADLKAKIDLLQKWTIEEVMPVLAFHQSSEQNYSFSVQKMGEYLQTEEYLRQSTSALTTQNSEYWKAMNAINRGDGIIYLSKIFMHIANGEFDLANRYLLLGSAMVENNTLVQYYYKQLDFRMEWLFDDLRGVILKGKAWQQEGDFHGAELYYDEMLKIMPKSAELNFEKYYSHSLLISHRPPEEIIALWETCREKVYQCDPLFAMNTPAKSREEMYYLSMRHELRQMLDDKANIKANLVTFADYAFDLKAYNIAAHLYFMIYKNEKLDEATLLTHGGIASQIHSSSQNGGAKKDTEAYYLYCMNELGRLPENYEKDVIKNRFKKIEKERAEVMESSELLNHSKSDNPNEKENKGKKKRGKDKD